MDGLIKMTFFGVGIDIESVSRFKNLNRKGNRGFLGKIFTENELNYCFSKLRPEKHLAARFAGKEALIKALSNSNKSSIYVNDIEILNDQNGVPHAKINSNDDSLAIHLSLSHCDDLAIAFCLVMGMDIL